MLQIPQRSAARDCWARTKGGGRRGRTYGPFQSPGIPGIVPGFGSPEIRNNQVSDESEGGNALYKCADGHEKVQRVPTAAGLIRVNAPRHSEQARNVHQIKGEMESDQK